MSAVACATYRWHALRLMQGNFPLVVGVDIGLGRPSDRELTNGPGKLCQALGIDRALDAADLLGPRVWIERGEGPLPRTAIARGPRIGIDYAERWAAMPWRFWIRGNPFVSRPPARVSGHSG